jgi:hypothetical protein
MPLTHSLGVSIILALAAACSAQDGKAPYTQPPYTQPTSTKSRTEPQSKKPYQTPPRKDKGEVCLVPDFSAYGPLVSGVTPVRNDSGPDYAVVKDAQEKLKYCNTVQLQQEQWALNVLSCFDNPSVPVWHEVHWRCLIGKVTIPFPQRQKEGEKKAGSTAWIPENRQVHLGFYWLFVLSGLEACLID